MNAGRASAELEMRPDVESRRTDDDRLMIRIQEGERAAFDAIVVRHQGALYGFFLKNTRDATLSEDLTQETLLKIYNLSWDYLPLGKFRGWMFRIARNLLIDTVRRRGHDVLVHALRSKSRDDESAGAVARLACDILPPELQANEREFAALVDGFLAELPTEQRMTFTLHHFQGLSLPEVAEVLESSVPTTKSRLRLAREKLQVRLTKIGIRGPNAG